MSKQDGLAYDGSSKAQKRALTAWERDLLCRAIYVSMQIQARTHLPFVATDEDEVDALIEIYDAINPRED